MMNLEQLKQNLTGLDCEDSSASHGGFNRSLRENGLDWPCTAPTMVGLKRLNNIQDCIEDTIANNVCGDLIETGVWRGGATIFMRACLKYYNITDKTVWVADSFCGLPRPSVPQDANCGLYAQGLLRVGLEEVKNNFKKYDMLDDQVRFLEGWFCDTLPTIPDTAKFSVVRLDGDMYESTMTALKNLYPKLSVGGYLIIDDYSCVPYCNLAVNDYIAEFNVEETMTPVDACCVFWKKLK